jgi:hypothetical protein
MDIRRGLQIPVSSLCGGARATTTERELAATDGVLCGYVYPATETTHVDYDPAETDAWVLARVNRAGRVSDRRPLEAVIHG